MKIKIESGEEREGDEEKEPPKKIMKLDNSEGEFINARLCHVMHATGSTAADLERAQREIEQLKTDREVAVEKKDKQVPLVYSIIQCFKKKQQQQKNTSSNNLELCFS